MDEFPDMKDLNLSAIRSDWGQVVVTYAAALTIAEGLTNCEHVVNQIAVWSSLTMYPQRAVFQSGARPTSTRSPRGQTIRRRINGTKDCGEHAPSPLLLSYVV